MLATAKMSCYEHASRCFAQLKFEVNKKTSGGAHAEDNRAVSVGLCTVWRVKTFPSNIRSYDTCNRPKPFRLFIWVFDFSGANII